MKDLSIGIMSIATNIYLDYWKNLVISIDKYVTPNQDVVVHIFTDKAEEAQNFSHAFPKLNIRIYKIPAYRWPEATLLRFRIFDNFKDNLTQDILMYLDADMIVHDEAAIRLPLNMRKNEITLVRHPGFFRPKSLSLLHFYLTNPKVLVHDMYMKIKIGGLGAWETDKSSVAFVKRRSRKEYFCGGVWFGPRSNILDFVRILDERVQHDQTKNIMAKWHDESHLNWWAANNKVNRESPSFCYSSGYKWLSGLDEYIEAVEKNVSTRN